MNAPFELRRREFVGASHLHRYARVSRLVGAEQGHGSETEEEQEQLSLSQLKERQMHPKSQSPPNEHNHENKKCMKKVHFNLEKNTVLIAPHLSYASDHGDSQVHPGQSAVQRMQTGFGHLDFPPLAPTQVLESSDIIFDGPPHIAPQMTGEPDYSDSRYGLGFGGQDRLPVNSSRFQQPPQPVLSHHQFALDPNSINRSLLNQNLFNSLLEETGNTQQPNSGHNRMPTEERGWHTDRPAQSNLFLPHFGGASRKQENQPIFQSRHTFEGDHLQYSNVPTEAKHRSQTTASPEFGSSLVSGQTLGSPAGQTNWQQTGGSYAPERLQSSGYHAAAIFNSTANPISPLKSGLNVKKPAPQTGIEQTALTAEDHRGTDQLPPTVDQHSYYYQPQDETSFSFYNGHTYSQQQPQRASTNLMTSMYSPSQTYPSQPIQQLDQPIYEPTSVSKTLFESQAEDLQILENGSYGQGWPSASSYQQQTANSSSHRYR